VAVERARVLSLFLHVAVFVSETEFHRQECLSLCIFFVLCIVSRAWLQRALLADDRTKYGWSAAVPIVREAFLVLNVPAGAGAVPSVGRSVGLVLSVGSIFNSRALPRKSKRRLRRRLRSLRD